jgi:hypothetical protein
LVEEDGTINGSFKPPGESDLRALQLQNFEPDPEVLHLYEPCFEALHRAREKLGLADIASAQDELDAIEEAGRNSSWALAGKNSFSDGSEPWWTALVLRARLGPLSRITDILDDLERELDLRSPAGWGGQMAYSAALGEIAIQLARNGQRDESERMLRRLMDYCESLNYMEFDIDNLKRRLRWHLPLLEHGRDQSLEAVLGNG